MKANTEMKTVSKDYPGTQLVHLTCQITKKIYEKTWHLSATFAVLQLVGTCRYCLTPLTQWDISKLFHVLSKPSEWMSSC